jgi:hypothetical protein
MELAQWCVDKGATDFNEALQGACETNVGAPTSCQGGSMRLAQWCVDRGATDFSLALHRACKGGYLELAQWCVDKGATDFNGALQYTSDETIKQWLQKSTHL